MFEIKDKVFIKSLNKEGIVCGVKFKYDPYPKMHKTSYDVRFEGCDWERYGWLGYMEQNIGKTLMTREYSEGDLQPINPPKVDPTLNSDVVDAFRYMMQGYEKAMERATASLLDTFSPKTSHGEFFLDASPYIELKHQLRPEDIVTAGHSCDHSWKLYEGFTNRYEYCEKCDVKK